MNFKFTRFLSLIMVMFTMFSMSAFAGGSSYYSKTTAKAVGQGKVYVKYGSAADSYSYAAESSATSEAQDSQSHTYYLYAQANDGNSFVGWFNDEACESSAVSTDAVYQVTVKATSKDSGSPTTVTYYAKFVDASAPSLVYNDGHVYVNLSSGTYKNETLTTENVTETITYESSNTNVATVATDGTVTLKKNGSCYIKAKSGEGQGSYILTVIDDAAAGVTQIGNGDFEDWRGVTSNNHAPDNWNSFETNDGSESLAKLARAQQVQMVVDRRPGSDGLYCADIYSRDIYSIAIAQGNLTTGCIYAGSATADAKENYNYSITSNPQKSETLSKIPSAIRFWAKFVPGKTNSSYPNALMQAVVHDKYDYITYCKDSYESDEEKSHAIAKAKVEFTTDGMWKEFEIPFEMTGNLTSGQMYILINFATNAVPAKGQEGDHLYIDDVELVYPEPVVYNKYIGITVNGSQATPVEAPIEVTHNNDNTIDFNLKNFGMGSMYVGNITVPDLPMDKDGNFFFDGSIRIEKGDLPDVSTWVGPGLGAIPLQMTGTIKDDYFYVHIDISMAGQDVVVEAGDLASATLSVSEALIGTFCAPFTIAIPSDYQSFVTVSTITGANSNVLTLEPIENGVIPANTPVIVEIPMAQTLPVSGIYVKGTPVAGLLTGVYENTNAPVGSYVLQNNDGKVGFYKVASGKQPTVTANHCYLTVDASNIKAFYFNEDDATGIENVNVNANEGAIYNVAGQRISKIQKGINIINGKKILK